MSTSLDSLPIDLIYVLIICLDRASDARGLILCRNWRGAWADIQAEWLMKWRKREMIHLVCSSGHSQVLQRLTVAGKGKLYLNSFNSSGLAPLHLAAIGNHPEIIKMLILSHADVNITDSWGQTSLMKASSKGSLAAATALIIHSPIVSVNAEDDLGISALGVAASLSQPHEDLVALLISHGADMKRGGGEAESAFHRACTLGRVWAVSQLLSVDGGILSLRAGDGATPLHRACQAGQIEVARILLGAAMSQGGGMKEALEAVDDSMRLALHMACSSRSPRMIDLILGCMDDSGLPSLINARDESGKTPLHHLLLNSNQSGGKQNGEKEILVCLDLLIEDGDLDVMVPDAFGCTPLMFAEGWEEVCELLKMAGG
jgi:ankyrin repeat protein